MNCAEIFVVDRATRVTSCWLEVYLPSVVVREVIGRLPAVEQPELMSWGHVNTAEVEALFRAEGRDRAHEEALALGEEYPPERTFWSLVVVTEEC